MAKKKVPKRKGIALPKPKVRVKDKVSRTPEMLKSMRADLKVEIAEIDRVLAKAKKTVAAHRSLKRREELHEANKKAKLGKLMKSARATKKKKTK